MNELAHLSMAYASQYILMPICTSITFDDLSGHAACSPSWWIMRLMSYGRHRASAIHPIASAQDRSLRHQSLAHPSCKRRSQYGRYNECRRGRTRQSLSDGASRALQPLKQALKITPCKPLGEHLERQLTDAVVRLGPDSGVAGVEAWPTCDSLPGQHGALRKMRLTHAADHGPEWVVHHIPAVQQVQRERRLVYHGAEGVLMGRMQ